jgi:hypothetical protein
MYIEVIRFQTLWFRPDSALSSDARPKYHLVLLDVDNQSCFFTYKAYAVPVDSVLQLSS